MGASQFSGPAIAYGDMTYTGVPASSLSSPDYNPDAGPGIEYQGSAIPDVRFPLAKDNLQLGSLNALLNSPYIKNVDMLPTASTGANIAALANVTSGTAMTLVSTSGSGVTVGVPIYPFGSNVLTTVLGLDMGFATANCTSGSATVTLSAAIINTNYFYVGQWIAIMNVGNASGNIPLFTQITAIGATTITVSPSPAATNSTTAFIANCNIPGPRMGNPVPTAVWPYAARGCSSFINPSESCMRGVRVTGVASGTGGHFIINGYDVYGRAQSEDINCGAGVNTVYGKKTFKYIRSVVPQFTDPHNYSIGTSDIFGFIVRSDKFEDTNIFWNGAYQTANTGWTAADYTTPATTTTTDVRGVVQLGVNGPYTGYTTSPNGSIRFCIYTNVSIYNQLAANAITPQGMFGVTPV